MKLDRYSHIAQAVFDQPWAILPETFAKIVDLVHLRNAGITLNEKDIAARIGGDPRERPETEVVDGVGVISMFGVIAQRMNLFASISGGTSTEQMSAEFRALVGDRDVRAILFAIDSPGGSVYGIEELVAEVRAARGTKPIVAVATPLAASAAYWIGSAADEFVVTPSGDVGSIGIVMAHTDISGAQEKTGVRTELISAGKYKTEGNPFGPLSDEARANLQARVDATMSKFVRDVAVGRGVSEAAVRAGFGQGRVVSAADAVDLGMVDSIATVEATLMRLQGRSTIAAPAPLRATAAAPAGRAAASRRMPESLWRALMESEL